MLKKLNLYVFYLSVIFFFEIPCANALDKNSSSIQKEKTLVESDFDEDFTISQEELISNIDDFVSLPNGGTHWKVFGETKMDEYKFIDEQGFDWTGVRPKFSEEIKRLDSKKILIQGYMFPLDQDEKQKTFLLVPFPATCPYHPHVSSNLIIEVHAKSSIKYSYEPVNVSGMLELVPKDDLYNIFFRLNQAVLVSN